MADTTHTEPLEQIAAQEDRVAELESQRAEALRRLDALRDLLRTPPDDGANKAPTLRARGRCGS